MVNAVQRKTASTSASRASLVDLPVAAAWLDGEQRIREASATLAGLLAKTLSEIDGKPLLALLDDAAADQTRGAYRFATSDGDVWLKLDLHKVEDGWLGALVDVSAEHRAYEQLKYDFLARDRLLLDAEIGTWRYDPDSQIYYFSHELSLGYETAGQPVPLETLQTIQHRDDKDADTAIRDRLTSAGGNAEAEMRYRDGQGGWRHLRALYRSGQQLPSGKFEMFGLSQNVTDLAKARDEANILAQRLKLALTAAGAGVFEYDFKRRSLWISPELQSLIGEAELAALNDDPLGIYHPDDRETARALFAYGRSDIPAPADVRLAGPGGEFVWVRLYWQTEFDGAGAPRRGVGLLLNIDVQKHQEFALEEARKAAEQASASRSNFLASVSHEIRTPMNGIIGVLHLLERETLSAEGRDMLAEALSCSDMLGQLINDVLDFSKMEAGKLEITPVPTDPAAVMEGVTALLQPLADVKNLFMRQTASTDGWAMVDPVRLRQCLFNMLGNAVKFTEQGAIEARMHYVGEGPARRLRCEVQDTGIGIPESARASLFDRFQQADSGTNRKFGGTGLGLAISRSLTRMMGGDMDFVSEEGKGSTFWFEIAAPPAAAPAVVAHMTADAPLTGLKILLVDDNRTNRLVGLKTLEALGAQGETADSGEAAIQALMRCAFDLVLMDINMPGMDGMEATRRIRALDADVAAVPVVALTADVMTHHQQAYLAAGMNGFVPKPFAPTDLLREISRLAS